MATTPYPFVANTVLTASQLNSTFNVPVGAKTASYTLVAADGGTRVQMNSASATTITVNTSLFSAGDSVWIQNIGAGTCTVTAGTATVSTGGSLAVTQYKGGELYFVSTSAAIFFPSGGTSVAKNITVFTASGTYTPATGVTYAIAYITGGGGGGGKLSAGAGGNSSVAFAGGTVTATGGGALNHNDATVLYTYAGAANSGYGAGFANADGSGNYSSSGNAGNGAIIVAGNTVTPAVGVTVTVGAGGAAGTSGSAGGTGYVYIEWYA